MNTLQTFMASGVHANLNHLLIGVIIPPERKEESGIPFHSTSQSPVASASAKLYEFSPNVPGSSCSLKAQ